MIYALNELLYTFVAAFFGYWLAMKELTFAESSLKRLLADAEQKAELTW